MAGRPTVVTEKVLALLKEAFEWGCTDVEACLHAEIDEATLYRYQEANPEYASKKKAWKERPILKARKCVVDALDTDKDLSLKYLERKKKDEFSLKSEVDQNVKGNISISIGLPSNEHNNTISATSENGEV